MKQEESRELRNLSMINSMLSYLNSIRNSQEGILSTPSKDLTGITS